MEMYFLNKIRVYAYNADDYIWIMDRVHYISHMHHNNKCRHWFILIYLWLIPNCRWGAPPSLFQYRIRQGRIFIGDFTREFIFWITKIVQIYLRKFKRQNYHLHALVWIPFATESVRTPQLAQNPARRAPSWNTDQHGTQRMYPK